MRWGRRPTLRLEPWQRNQYIVVLTVAAAHLGFDFSGPFLPLFVRQELGITDVGAAALWSGVLVGITPGMVSIMAPLWGALADRYGHKRLVLRAMWAISLCSLAQAFAPDVYWAFAARFVMGIFGGFTPMAMALAISSGPRDRVGQAVGLMQAAQFLPLAIGPPIGGLLADAFGLRMNWVFSAVVTGLSAVMLIVLFKEDSAATQARGQRRQDRKGGGTLALFALPGFAAALVVLFLAQCADRSLPPVLPLYLSQIGTDPGQLATVTGLVISAGAVAAAASSTLYGRLTEPQRVARIMPLALGGGAICIAALALTNAWGQVLVLRLLLGLVAGGSVGLAYTLGARLAPPDRAGVALGLLGSCSGLGGAVSPMLAGVVGQVSLAAVFVTGGVLYLLALAVTFLFLRRGRAFDRERTPS